MAAPDDMTNQLAAVSTAEYSGATTMINRNSAARQVEEPSRLLELPYEMFEQIIVFLLQDDKAVAEALPLRRICKAFDNAIMERLIRVATCAGTNVTFDQEYFKQIFVHHASAIIQHKAMRDDIPDYDEVIKFVQRVVGYLPIQSGLSAVERRRQRVEHTSIVCNAMVALDPTNLRHYFLGWESPTELDLWNSTNLLPALAAASGDIAPLRRSLTLESLQPPACKLFPNALDAAVACRENDAVETILRFIAANIRKGSRRPGSWSEFRRIARCIYRALRVAIRLHNNAALETMFAFLGKQTGFRRSFPIDWSNELFLACIVNRNVDALAPVIEYGMSDGPVARKFDLYMFSGRDMMVIFRRCSPRALQALIDIGEIDPHRFCSAQKDGLYSRVFRAQSPKTITPLILTLLWERLDLARVLIGNGARIDDVLPWADQSLLITAVKCCGHCTFDHIKDLLLLGASPGHIRDTGSPWGLALRGADSCYHIEGCLFLFEALAAHGHAYLERPDIFELRKQWGIHRRACRDALMGREHESSCESYVDDGERDDRDIRYSRWEWTQKTWLFEHDFGDHC